MLSALLNQTFPSFLVDNTVTKIGTVFACLWGGGGRVPVFWGRGSFSNFGGFNVTMCSWLVNTIC